MGIDGPELQSLLNDEVLGRINNLDDVDLAMNILLRTVVSIMGNTIRTLPEEQHEKLIEEGTSAIIRMLEQYRDLEIEHTKKNQAEERILWFSRLLRQRDSTTE